MTLMSSTREHVVAFLGGLPPKAKRPSKLFEDMGYVKGDILFTAARLALVFDDIDERLARVKGSATRIVLSNGSKITIPHENGTITIEAMFMRLDGRQYIAICSQRGRECNSSIEELRRYVSHTLPRIPRSKN